jgi:hypothetical protein
MPIYGTIVNATVIAVPGSINNKAGKLNPQMHHTSQGNWGLRCRGTAVDVTLPVQRRVGTT